MAIFPQDHEVKHSRLHMLISTLSLRPNIRMILILYR